MDANEYLLARDIGRASRRHRDIDVIDVNHRVAPQDVPTAINRTVVAYPVARARHLPRQQNDTTHLSRLQMVMRKALHSSDELTWALLGAAASLTDAVRRLEVEGRVAARSSPNRYQCLHDIVVMEHLAEGWAGPGTVAVISHVAHIASELVRLLPDGVASPQVTSSGDGDIGLTWVTTGNKIEVTVDHERVVCWVAKMRPDRYSGACKWDNEMPAELVKWLHLAHK